MAGTVGIYPGGPRRLLKQSFPGATAVEPIAGNDAADPMGRARRQRHLLGVIIAVLSAAMTGLWLGSTIHRVSPGPVLGLVWTTPHPPPIHTRQ